MLTFLLVEGLEGALCTYTFSVLKTSKHTEQPYAGRDKGWVTCDFFPISMFRVKILL